MIRRTPHFNSVNHIKSRLSNQTLPLPYIGRFSPQGFGTRLRTILGPVCRRLVTRSLVIPDSSDTKKTIRSVLRNPFSCTSFVHKSLHHRPITPLLTRYQDTNRSHKITQTWGPDTGGVHTETVPVSESTLSFRSPRT